MRRLLALGLLAGMVVGYLSAGEAGAAAQAAGKSKFFLRDTDGCDAANFLSRKDGEDSGCWWVDRGPLYDGIAATGLLSEDELSEIWTASDGLPFKLNATKPLTGSISTTSGSCYAGLVDDSAPCSPEQIGAGRATLKVKVAGMTAGEEILLGTHTEDFVVAPASSHTSTMSLELDEALNKKKFTGLKVTTYLAGAAVGHGIIELEDPASFITVPTWVKKKR